MQELNTPMMQQHYDHILNLLVSCLAWWFLEAEFNFEHKSHESNRKTLKCLNLTGNCSQRVHVRRINLQWQEHLLGLIKISVPRMSYMQLASYYCSLQTIYINSIPVKQMCFRLPSASAQVAYTLHCMIDQTMTPWPSQTQYRPKEARTDLHCLKT